MFSEEDYKEAVEIFRREDRASTSFLQRTFQIGYNTAAAMMQRMEREGVVTAPNHMGKREVLKP